MPGIGTIVNVLAVLICGVIGLGLKKGISEKMQSVVYNAIGLGTFFIGISGTMSIALTANEEGALSSRFGIILILSLVIGSLIGEKLDIDGGFEKIGKLLQKRKGAEDANDKAGAGFAMATVLFCSGAMSIVGAMEDVAGNPQILFSKAILDGIGAIIFASVYGAEILLSAVSVLVYQGFFSLLTVFISGYIPEVMIEMISFVGLALLIPIAFNLWGIKKFKVGNMMPAIFMPAILYWIPFLR